MKPTLVSGDYLIAINFLNKFIKKNSLIIFFDKTHSYIIKRVKAIKEDATRQLAHTSQLAVIGPYKMRSA